jgi:tetratricopeptide (TPR) repeat protein
MARAHFESGRLLLDAGETERGIEHLRSTVELLPSATEARATLATSLARAGRFDDAAETFDQLLALEPRRLDAHMGRAMALLLGGREAAAVDAIEASLVELPDAAPLVHLLGRVLATTDDPALRDGERALAAAQRALTLAPGPVSAETLAMALAELGRFDEAIAVQSRAIAEARRSGTDLGPMEERLKAYRESRPVRSPWVEGS